MRVVRPEGDGGSGGGNRTHALVEFGFPEIGLLYLFHLTSVLIFGTTFGADGPGPTPALSIIDVREDRKGLIGSGRGGHEGDW